MSVCIFLFEQGCRFLSLGVMVALGTQQSLLRVTPVEVLWSYWPQPLKMHLSLSRTGHIVQAPVALSHS